MEVKNELNTALVAFSPLLTMVKKWMAEFIR